LSLDSCSFLSSRRGVRPGSRRGRDGQSSPRPRTPAERRSPDWRESGSGQLEPKHGTIAVKF
jgi:hypothetical protein